VSPGVAANVAAPEIAYGHLKEIDDDHARLSNREIAVLTAMTDGVSSEESLAA
jgi:hypothetical protein